MESLNLKTLANSLPTGQQNAEKDLLNNFKAAALSITTLYRSSRQNSKRAYNTGYAAACQDLLTMIQQGVSVGGIDSSGSSHNTEGGGMTIGRVMDWTEARLEAIRSREEEEEEEEEREKERGTSPAAATSADRKPDQATNPNVPKTTNPQTRDQPASLPTPNSPHLHLTQLPLEPSSPSPPPSAALRQIQRPAAKARPLTKGDIAVPYMTPAGSGFNYMSDGLSSISSPSASFSDIPIPIAAGAKRRHAMMMMLDSASSPLSIGSSSTPPTGAAGNGASGLNHGSGTLTSRRRTRSSRNLTLHQSQNQNLNLIQAASEAMDVEDDAGRERKRVARR